MAIVINSLWLLPSLGYHLLAFVVQSIGRPRQLRYQIMGKWLRVFLLRMGPLYVKMGQILSTRSDLIPAETALELSKLQDDVPPMPAAATRSALAAEFGKDLSEVFAEFDMEPVASASIAQVHVATLKTGEKVAVKIVKRGVPGALRRNLDLVYFLVRVMHALVPPVRSLNLRDRFREIRVLLLTQTDMRLEAENQKALRSNFQNHPFVKIPALFEQHCGPNVLVMEYVDALKGKDFRKTSISRKQLAKRFQDVVYTMLYMDGVCHGDPHPGNIFFSKEGDIIFVDFGITVYMSEDEKWGLSSFYYACTRGEWRIAVNRFTEHFVVHKEHLEKNFPAYAADVEVVLQKHFKVIENKWSTTEFFKDINVVLKKYRAEYVTNFTKAELALASCEGFARQIDPDIDVWDNARKFSDRYSPYMNPAVTAKFDRHFQATIPGSMALRDRAKSTLVAPTHLDRYFLPSTYPIFVKKAYGSRIEDADGNVFVDLSCGYGPHILGYAHPAITGPLSEAIQNGNVNALGNKAEIMLAETLVAALPHADKVIFSNSGTESLIHAMRICRAYKKNAPKIAKCEGHYHGFSDQAMVSSWFRFSGSKERPAPVSGTQGCHPGLVKDTVILQYGMVESLEALYREKDSLACVICEPMPATMAKYDVVFLRKLREVCTELDIPLVFDEVVTGFRVDYGGAQTLAGVEPDLTCLGKIIGGSLPCGAVAGKSYLIEMAKTTSDPFIDYEQKTFVGGTMSGNYLSCAAGLAAVTHLRDNPGIYTELARKTEWLCAELKGIADGYDVPFRIKGNRSIFTMNFSYKEKKYYREHFSGSNFKANLALAYYMRKNGVYMPELHSMLIGDSHSDGDLKLVSKAFEASLKEMVTEGFFVL